MAEGNAGYIFDIQDKALARRGYELYAREFIYRQDYDQWMSDYNRLEAYALANSNDRYVASQWAAEKPRYANAPSLLLSKVRIANPVHYDESISISGRSDCGCCGGNQLPFVPTNYTPTGGGFIPSRSGSNYFLGGNTLGDGVRGLFSPNNLPFFPMPGEGENKLIDKSEIASGVIVAIIVGAILWGVHYLTKKKLAT